jgi:hypothetical protein
MNTKIQEAATPRAIFAFFEKTCARPIGKMAPLPPGKGIAAAMKTVVSGQCNARYFFRNL